MTKSLLSFVFLILLLPTTVAIAYSQSYFKIIKSPKTGYYQRLGHFSNGDILVAEKSQEGLVQHKGIFLIRMDECGQVVWDKMYEWSNELLTLTQIKVGAGDHIFIYGARVDASTSSDGFVMKVDGDGTFIDMFLFDSFEVEHPYAMDIKNGQVMLSGLANSIPSTTKSYFILVLDENLNLLWQKTYTPFKAFGEAILTSMGGTVFTTGNVLTKTNGFGEIEWAQELVSDQGLLPMSRPVGVDGGYVFSISYGFFNWVFKLDETGNLLWKSKKVPSFYHNLNLQQIPGTDQILAVYHRQVGDFNVPAYIIFSSTGEILSQYYLDIDVSLNSGFTYLHIQDDHRINLLGNANMNFFDGDYNQSDFYMQFYLNQPAGDCFSWLPYEESEVNDFDLELIDFDLAANGVFFDTQINNSISISPLNTSIISSCEIQENVASFTVDTLLACTDIWQIDLTDDEFIWQDGNTDNPRQLFFPGIYVAEKSSCEGLITYTYDLKKSACPCPIFIPNAFSPNQDGINDVLDVFSDCQIEDLYIKIYNRWGAIIFEGSQNKPYWDGKFNGKIVPAGVYVVMINGFTQNALGALLPFEKVQDVLVVY